MWLGNHFLSNFKQNLRCILQQPQSTSHFSLVQRAKLISKEKLIQNKKLSD